jgi:predicted ATPase
MPRQAVSAYFEIVICPARLVRFLGDAVKITALNVPAGYRGLNQVRLAELGAVVLLAGPNGAGKSRLLRCVAEFGGACLTRDERISYAAEESSLNGLIQNNRVQIESAIAGGADSEAPQLVQLRTSIGHWENNSQLHRDRIEKDCVIEREPDAKPIVVPYDVERTSLRDWKDMRQREVLQLAENMESEFSVRIVPDAGLAAVRKLINKFVYASHANSPDLSLIGDEVARLKGLVQEFLGAELGWDLDGDPTLFGRPIADADLSAGQLVLFQVALSLFFQKGGREDLVLLMDEPENHLHPSAVLTMIDEVRRNCPNAQLWIATHSVHILAHFSPNDIWFVKDGTAEHAGRRSVDVLHSLVGGERGSDELLEFMALPAQNALLAFATQCLAPPQAVDTALGDPQTSQISTILTGLAALGRPIRVLDFGMGTGRLLSELVASVTQSGRDFVDVFDYVGFDSHATEENRAQCEERLVAAYPLLPDASAAGRACNKKRYFAEMEELVDSLDSSSVDIVVMCNTLHEIPPEDWLQYFGPQGSISVLLRGEGYLLIVEDQLLPVGERAHKYGYLVLDAPELKALTKSSNEDGTIQTFYSVIPKYEDRLKGHLIPAPAVRRVDVESRRRALSRLQARAMEKAEQLAQSPFNARSGRLYGFWCHQHVNAGLALRSLYGASHRE